MMMEMGYDNVGCVDGGMVFWMESGLPIKTTLACSITWKERSETGSKTDEDDIAKIKQIWMT